MCELTDLISIDPLYEILKNYNNNDNQKVNELVKRSLSPHQINDTTISFTAWNFDITKTIYSKSKASEIVNGWNLLLERKIPIDIYIKIMYTISLYSFLSNSSETPIELKDGGNISNTLEPAVLEILRLCYWIYKCKLTIDSISFDSKFTNVKKHLTFKDEIILRQNLDKRLIEYGKILKDTTITYDNRERFANDLIKELDINTYRSNISSIIPELMTAAIIKESGFDISFIDTSSDKSCDLLLDSSEIEIKMFLDPALETMNIENTLIKEIEGTLKRKKAECDINDCLDKNADISLLFLTFSSLAIGLSKYAYANNFRTNIYNTIQKALLLSKTYKQNRSHIPVIVITTLLDAINCEYKIFSFTISYPLKEVKKNVGKRVNPQKLALNIKDIDS